MQYSGNKSPTRIAQQIAEQKQNDLALERRVSLLRKTTGVKDEDIAEYEKSEIIRKAIRDVKKNAAVKEVTRLSPKRLYSGVKSKVGGNMRSIRKSQNRVGMMTISKEN